MSQFDKDTQECEAGRVSLPTAHGQVGEATVPDHLQFYTGGRSETPVCSTSLSTRRVVDRRAGSSCFILGEQVEIEATALHGAWVVERPVDSQNAFRDIDEIRETTLELA